MRRVWSQRWPALLALLLLAAGCTRGPDADGLQQDVQAQLDTLFGQRMLEVKSLNRQGSAPLGGAPSGGRQAIVYYNAVLRFTAPYDPSDWAGLSPELIAEALGATDEGVIGLGAGRIAAGAELRAYGSMVYRRERNMPWQPSLLPPAATNQAGLESTRVTSSDLVARLAGIVNTTPGLHAEDDAIVAEELDNALQNIKLRLNRGEHGLVVATGPADGEYARFIESLKPRAARWSVTQATTAGSVANALLIDAGEARFGLVQSDVAAAAVTGQDAFASHGPLRHLRAVAALFPEPVHVVVRQDAKLEAIEGLRGKRVALGSRGSGTRQTALQVLRAHGLGHGDYVVIETHDPAEALDLLAAGRIDAVIEVDLGTVAPARGGGGPGAAAAAAARSRGHAAARRDRARAAAADDPRAHLRLAAGRRRHARGDRAAGRRQRRAGRRGDERPRLPVQGWPRRRPRRQRLATVARARTVGHHHPAARRRRRLLLRRGVGAATGDERHADCADAMKSPRGARRPT